jgi:hypothetical protein
MAPRPLVQNQKNPSSWILQNIWTTAERLFLVKFKDETITLSKTEAGVQQRSVLGPVLYLIYTSDLQTSDNTSTATFVTVLATHEDAAIASIKLQATIINKMDDWAKTWRIKINLSKSTHITFALCNETCQTVQMGRVDLPQKNEVKYIWNTYRMAVTQQC